MPYIHFTEEQRQNSSDSRESRSTVKRALGNLVKAELVEKSSRWRENGSLSYNLHHIK